MKTYITDIIPKIQRFSQKLNDLTFLINQHWVVIDEMENKKMVYIFRSNNELLISENGNVQKAKWEYLGHNSLLIDFKNESQLFKHSFFDENILALKIDGREEYAFLINETRYGGEFNSVEKVLQFLKREYIEFQIKNPVSNNKLNTPNYQLKKVSETFSLLSGKTEIYKVLFDDGIEGDVFLNKKTKHAYFKDNKSLAWSISNHYYENLDYCVHSLHAFLKTGEKLTDGFRSTHT